MSAVKIAPVPSSVAPKASVPLANAEARTTARTATWKDYLALTKPRVISLLLFTTLAAMFVAARGWPGGWLFLAVALGGYMAAGAANAINMVIDRDIDGAMTRTAKRPTVTQSIPTRSALAFAFALEAASFALLSGVANVLAASLALAGLLFYVFVYTLLLKRRTWHNIVIGGAAGAFPPLVGWAAVTGGLSPLAWYLFGIVFAWTPVHFWALALLIKDDYARAGIPMLPVVRGERATVLQIGLYAVLTAVVSILPWTLGGEVRAVYLLSAALLNALLLVRSWQLFRSPDRPRAVSLYKYSMLYLALLFLAMAVDRAVAI
uniref:Protoheme IX farnesyltransferase n=1 Tax=uncultured Armatimonadetes bacterium TaxID=157466 RepID=A0A6J4H6J3_9BACT|nr:Heme O synthase, protoheme IX farnesyltransferase COX10-CtaB [uncultured Armatimonadetes bacterium]